MTQEYISNFYLLLTSPTPQLTIPRFSRTDDTFCATTTQQHHAKRKTTDHGDSSSFWRSCSCFQTDLCTPPDVIDLCSSSSSSSCSSDSSGETLVFVTKDNATDEWDGNLFRRSELYHDCTGSSDDFSTCSSDPWIMEILQRR